MLWLLMKIVSSLSVLTNNLQQFFYIDRCGISWTLVSYSINYCSSFPVYWFFITVQYSTVQCGIVQYSTVRYSTVQYSAVRYSTVQYIKVHYSTVQHISVHYSVAQYSTVHYRTVYYSTVQHILVHYSTVQCSTVQYSKVWYSVVQYSTVHYSAVQYSTLQCSTVQYSSKYLWQCVFDLKQYDKLHMSTYCCHIFVNFSKWIFLDLTADFIHFICVLLNSWRLKLYWNYRTTDYLHNCIVYLYIMHYSPKLILVFVVGTVHIRSKFCGYIYIG